MDSKPIVYILHGEDEFSIDQQIEDFEERLGDPSAATLNTTRLEGAAFQPEQIMSIAGVVPFLADRRLVIISNGMFKLQSKEAQERFLAQLEKLPSSAAVILRETQTLKPPNWRDKKEHWLVAWAHRNPERAFEKAFSLPVGADWNSAHPGAGRCAGGCIPPGRGADALSPGGR